MPNVLWTGETQATGLAKTSLNKHLNMTDDNKQEITSLAIKYGLFFPKYTDLFLFKRPDKQKKVDSVDTSKFKPIG